MKNRKTLRKFLYVFFTILAIFNISTILVWKFFYFNPKEIELDKQKQMVYEQFYNKEYTDYKSLIKDLDTISNVSYSVESEEHHIDLHGVKEEINSNIFSELIKINNKTYLLKIYSNNVFDTSELAVTLIKAHIIVIIVFSFLSVFMLNSTVVKPLRNIVSDMQEYKFGKKPKKMMKPNNEIITIHNEFVSLTDALEEEKKEQNRIIASISHDLKTPLTSVIGYSNLILEKDMSKEQLIKYNEKINLKAKNMKDILNNFDEYLINKNSRNLKLRSVRIKDLLEQIKDDYEFDLKNVNIKLIIESDCLDELIKVDIQKIRRIIANVVDNSVRYIKTNGIIKIKVLSDNEYYKFTISDNGKGVDDRIIDKIFEPLFTTDNARKISGLGLSICKEFVELHGGKIKAYNKLGLTIEFTIPKEQSKK